ncbi:hypothetical protein ACET3X_001799 [Alternaria dauci]|uniref:Uncharacterized protein n=1 Tax=Alternaria dauci TaxID=48095 RepID=A0ABR3UYC5_9PLEO
MADRPKNDAKRREASPHPVSDANLQTPIHVPDLRTPSSTSSSIFSLSNFTLRSKEADRKAASDITLPSPAMDPVRYTRSDFEPWTPSPSYQKKLPNVHIKRQPETSEKSRSTRGIGIARAIEVRKRLQRVMGVTEPVPFVTPPAMPEDLEQEFVSGMKEYGLDNRMHNMKLDVLSQAASMQERLPEIKEEHESPVRDTWTFTQSGQEVTPCNPLVELSALDSPSSKDSKKPIGDGTDDPQPPALGQSSRMSGTEFEAPMSEPMPGFYKVGSSPLRMTSPSPAVNPISSDGFRPVHASYDTPSFAAFRKQMEAFEEQHMPAYSNAVPNMGSEDIQTSHLRHAHNYITRSDSVSSFRSVSRIKPLFPSPRVGTQSWDESKGVSQQHVSEVQPNTAPMSSQDNTFFENLFCQPPASSVPRIAVQAPSPTKLPSSKKRFTPQVTDELLGSAAKDTRPDNKKATGLPTLPASSSASWEVEFPGYTPALLTILLTWSHAMQSFYRRLLDSRTFPIHAAFPHSITPPVYNRVISVGFYDTSVVPHEEIRFLGPGDKAEIGYAEVDVFRSREEVAAFEAQEQEHFSKARAMKRKLGLGSRFGEQKGKMSVYQDQMHLANSGEGRWAYVLIRGHATSDEEVAPHVMLAWHLSAVTDTSTCLYTVFPDNHEPVLRKPPATSAPPKQPLRRLASLQNLVSPSRGQRHLHREIRSASCSAGSMEVEESSILPQEGAQTLKRTVVKLEKADSVPLIEGYRVDLEKFTGWLNAVGRGEGKVIVWRETSPATSLA